METGTRSLRSAFRKGSWSDWPLAIGFSLFSRLLIVREYGDASELPCARPASYVPRRREGPNGRNLNMLTESKTKLDQLATHVAIPRQLVDLRVEPSWGGLGPHPGELALGELARGGNATLDGLIEAVFSLEMRPELPISDRAHRGMACGQITPAVQRPHLFEEPRRHHAVKASGEALMQHRPAAGGQRPRLERHAGKRAHGLPLQLRDPAAGRVANLQSPLN